MTAPTAGPWDSPQVVTRNVCPNVLLTVHDTAAGCPEGRPSLAEATEEEYDRSHMRSDLLPLMGNLSFLDDVYQEYLKDPEKVDASWRELFDADQTPVTPRQPANGKQAAEAEKTLEKAAKEFSSEASKQSTASAPHPSSMKRRHKRPSLNIVPRVDEAPQVAHAMSVWPMVNAYRVRGHLEADLDPLDMLVREPHPELDPKTYGFLDSEMDKVFPSGGLFGVTRATLREIHSRLRKTYCGSIGLEFMHISNPAKKTWLAQRMEQSLGRAPVAKETRLAMLKKLAHTETFERFMHTKYVGTKRFSLEGSESLIPLLDLILEHGSTQGVREVVLGMAHRGRLCVLTQVFKKKPSDIFAEFEDVGGDQLLGSGDVKYHLGFSSDHETRHGHRVHLSLAFNPSHLEAVDPVVVGRVRAKQRRSKDFTHDHILGVLVHGDAAFAGQGLVPETLNLSDLHGYRTGGTIHVIVNNQIGFTTSPHESRSTPYCTDVAKMIQVPIFHVNGEDPDAVAQVVQLAIDYRTKFKCDVVIDMFCYRKYGHNEGDEPSFTQPLLYDRIRKKKSTAEIYSKRLLDQGVIDKPYLESMQEELDAHYEQEFQDGKKRTERPRVESLGGVWQGYVGGKDRNVEDPDTGVDRGRLFEIGERLVTFPQGFALHPRLQRLVDTRTEMGKGEKPLDWGMGELFAYGTLCWEGALVRMSGQDSSRGTFSHRHAVYVDNKTELEYAPLSHLHPKQGAFCIYDSPLSEAGVLGFEFGYSLDYPDGLVMWEGQFGDFVNGAQVIIDQFLTSSEDKWQRLSGLTMLLPHGFEGQGPEHSSARMERFLQSCAEDNIQVAQPTSPAQLFHLFRRQVVRKWRKPLVVMTPKSLLRHPMCTSELRELETGRYQRVMPDAHLEDASRVKRVALCTGKVYYDLVKEREDRGKDDIAFVRLEQLYPWDDKLIEDVLASYPKCKRVMWVQEEPENMGAWQFVEPRLRRLLDEAVTLVSRDASASPASGSSKAHKVEQAAIMNTVFQMK